MKADPCQGDWSELLKIDFEKYDIDLKEDKIRVMDTKIQVINKRKGEGLFISSIQGNASRAQKRQAKPT